MNPHLPENIIGMALGWAVIALGIWTARRVPKGWQPKPSWKRPGIRRPR